MFAEFIQQVIPDSLKITLGFFVALLLNSLVGYWRDRKTYKSMLRVIKGEAESNKCILYDSFYAHYQGGIVLREFSLDAVSDFVRNPLFVKHARFSGLETLQNYIRDLKLANAYRETAEDIHLKKQGEEWLDGLIFVWEENLRNCEGSIEAVTSLL